MLRVFWDQDLLSKFNKSRDRNITTDKSLLPLSSFNVFGDVTLPLMPLISLNHVQPLGEFTSG